MSHASAATADREDTGVVSRRRSRITGTVVEIIDNRSGHFDTYAAENPWYTVCTDHSGVCSHMTRQLAERFGPVPDEWCPGCQGDAGEPEDD